jgi:hypothetical protein
LTNDITLRTLQFLVNKEQTLPTSESAHMRGFVRKYPSCIVLKQYVIICICTVASFSHIIFSISNQNKSPGHKLLYAPKAM